jgi:hypothetical protein
MPRCKWVGLSHDRASSESSVVRHGCLGLFHAGCAKHVAGPPARTGPATRPRHRDIRDISELAARPASASAPFRRYLGDDHGDATALVMPAGGRRPAVMPPAGITPAGITPAGITAGPRAGAGRCLSIAPGASSSVMPAGGPARPTRRGGGATTIAPRRGVAGRRRHRRRVGRGREAC